MLIWTQLLIYISLLVVHPFHVSVCEIEFNAEQQSLEVQQSIFADDLEHALQSTYGLSKLDIMSKAAHDKNEEWIKKYVREHLIFEVAEKTLAFNWIGYQLQGHNIQCYFEFTNIPLASTIQVTNQILLPQFPKQKNMLHYKASDEIETTVLNRRKNSVTLSIP